MIIKVDISEETWARMLTGKRIEGTIALDLMTGRKDFKMFHRQSRSRRKDTLIKKLPYGWLKASVKKHKLFLSIDKDMPLDEELTALDHDHQEALEAIVDQHIIERA